MKIPGDVYIAGTRTATDWNTFRAKLTLGADPALWQKAFDDYFYERLSLRYLEPIKVLQDNGTYQGEGFSIVAIQCTLIEFLESTFQGISYRCRRKADPPLGKYEYSDSGNMFVQFLSNREPFSNVFDEKLGREFYANVRCGLLHEARTKDGWTIWAKGPANMLVSASSKIVYRDNFQQGLLQFIQSYQGALPSDTLLQEAFIRKFDSLCV
jgi:hypothetical protein